MKPNKESHLLHSSVLGPAFLVEDGIVTQQNDAAKHIVNIGARIKNLISLGLDEYSNYRSGKLYLQLSIGGNTMGACVTKLDSGHLFCLDSAFSTPELRVLALAAQQLRNPLSGAMINADLLQGNPTIQNDPQAKAYLSQLNRGLYQLLRAVGNMSDASGIHVQRNNYALRNATAIFDEMMTKSTAAIFEANRTLVYKGLKKPVDCFLDADLLERAVLNLISNAVKFSPEGTEIQVGLRHHENRLFFTIENSGMSSSVPHLHNAFNHFLREPGIDSNQYGIGLGMSIVLSAAAAHGGTVLFNKNRKNGAKVVMTIATDLKAPTILESPLQLIGSYYGGLDSVLVELSDILPDSSYELL